MRSSSFRRGSIGQTPISPTTNGGGGGLSLSPGTDEVRDIYRKQSARIDELEKENKRLAKEANDLEGRWRNTEEELEELRESGSEVAMLRSRAEKAVVQGEEISKMVSSIQFQGQIYCTIY